MFGWYSEKGPEMDVVISSRVRLARNLSDCPFPSRMASEQAYQVINRVRDSVLNSSSSAEGNFTFIDINKVGPVDRQVLVEKHLISPDLLEKDHTGAIISRDEKISIMINEEDHLRIQCLFPGFQLQNAYELCSKVDTMLEEKLDFACNKDFGYLTCCPTNVGTGIRASVMLHLPALVMTGYAGKVLEACSKLNVAVRGLYGENTEALGNLFQVSNQVTLGQSEEEILSGVNNVAVQIMEQERALRNELKRQDPLRFEDRIYRSFGIFANARLLSSEEGMKLLSDVRLGVDMGIINNIDPAVINELMLLLQPGSLQKAVGRPLGPDERDAGRAELVRNKLQNK